MQLPDYFIDGEDAGSSLPVFGIHANGFFIHQPFKSECGRFEVDPKATYGISQEDAALLDKLNEAIDKASEDAINAGCLAIQEALSVIDGGFAGVYFSDDTVRNSMASAFRQYLRAEMRMQENDDEEESKVKEPGPPLGPVSGIGMTAQSQQDDPAEEAPRTDSQRGG